MSSAEDRPEPDRIEGAPHPRETPHLLGQDAAEAAFLTAYTSGRLHHGWLITGPRGVGKATMAWRIARFLIATPMDEGDGLFGGPPPPETLDIAPDHPVARRMQAGAEPGLFLLRRGGMGSTDKDREKNASEGKFSKVIRVDETRQMKGFFSLSSADGGRRVVIIDSADDLNESAANAILKLLEEPPARTVLLLISHQPSRLLPTIRSRCRELRLTPMSPDLITEALAQAEIEVPGDPAALAELAGGSVGEAVRMVTLDGLKIYAGLVGLLATMPRFDASRAQALADLAAGRGGEETRVLIYHLIDFALARLARTGAIGQPPAQEAAPGEAEMLMRLSPSPAMGRAWATGAEEIGARLRHGEAVNLDPAALILDTVFKLQTIAGGQAA
ncbi:DNA polymerase III subunit delta' [Pseudooceanicola nitratireducens]|uniref:DNA polymerase III subunit delta' n=1 Tax=Pseudooceanicola nitratireducens TaxID=517719 RepID=UPI003102B88D